MHEFGRLVLNKNPENYHRDVEQAAFSPGAMVPGIEDSPDPLLQFRMFFYRDAQYHRIGVNMHQVPVNCPFMAGSLSSLNFDGNLRSDANHGGKPDYVPNSFQHKFRPDVAETPYKVSDNIVSRKSHYMHEGKKSEYTQATELYRRVMTDQQRANTHKNTSKLLSLVKSTEIQLKYLAQIYNVAPEYSRGVYDGLVEKKFSFEEVESKSQGAETWYKEPKFRPGEQDRLMGVPPGFNVYNV